MKRGYIVSRTIFGTAVKRYGSIRKAPPPPTAKYYPCILCNLSTHEAELLMCDDLLKDGTTCDQMVCFTCANVDKVPDGDFYCGQCT